MQEKLQPFKNVFFVHYQRGEFNIDESITSLNVCHKGKAKEFSSNNEVQNIVDYYIFITNLLNEGLTLVHWNQDRPDYGEDHIKKRYKELTGNQLNLDYKEDLNLAEWLISKYGQHYIAHPRLDNLAKKNQFYGISEIEKGQTTFPSNRVLLLTKIYNTALAGTLIIEPYSIDLEDLNKNIERKSTKLNSILLKYGFYDLPKVQNISESQKRNLLLLLVNNDMPYCIAMFDYLDFFDHLQIEFFSTKTLLFEEVAKWFNSGKGGRQVKGNIYTLNPKTKEDKVRFTAHLHIEKVINDYEMLK